MTQENRKEGIICPLCGSGTTSQTCHNCGEDLRLLYEARSHAITCYNLGLKLLKTRSQESEECLTLAIAFDAGFFEPYIVLGKLCAQQRRYSEAIKYWQKALGTDRVNGAASNCLQGLMSLFGSTKSLRLEAAWQGKPVRLGSEVQDKAGRRGRIWRLLPEAENQELTHIVVWTNSFFPEDSVIPVEHITSVNEHTVSIGENLRDLYSRMPKYREGA